MNIYYCSHVLKSNIVPLSTIVTSFSICDSNWTCVKRDVISYIIRNPWLKGDSRSLFMKLPGCSKDKLHLDSCKSTSYATSKNGYEHAAQGSAWYRLFLRYIVCNPAFDCKRNFIFIDQLLKNLCAAICMIIKLKNKIWNLKLQTKEHFILGATWSWAHLESMCALTLCLLSGVGRKVGLPIYSP